jgi:7-carboxy-7-deazaguanine synthase
MLAPDILARRLEPLEGAPPGALVLHEVYASIQGESSYAGLPCTFIRTTACHLRCGYCDTPHAFTQGRPWTADAVMQEVARLGPRLVEVTGGEPLLQKPVLTLMTRLADAGYTVLLETSGSLDIAPVDPRVVRIVDFKTPSSGEQQHNLWSNVDQLRSTDEVKLVIGDRADYEWARDLVRRHALHERCTVLFGSVWATVPDKELVAWILEDRLPVRMQLQLHKHIWDAKARGV